MGYVLHWVDRGDALELKRLVESEALRHMGAPVRILISQESVAISPDSGGLGVLTGLGLGFVVLMTGMILPPHLILEEKQTHTMDVLRVSLAGAGHIVVAKALTGLFYCFLALGLGFILNQVSLVAYLPQLAYMLAWALAVLLIVAWLVRRQDR
jgi:hypothetical protein